MKIAKNPKPSEWANLCRRPEIKQQNLQQLVEEVFLAIAEEDDLAVLSYTKIFDKAVMHEHRVSEDEINAARSSMPDDLRAAIHLAGENIKAFHRAQRTSRIAVETMPGVNCWQESRPIRRVGIYVPGGTAPLFSTVLMLAIPAAVAGCKDIVLCTPPSPQGTIHPAILYAAQHTGVKKIFKIGGIQAIGAMALGTASVPKVDKIFGPGNQYVTAAKQRAAQMGVAIDLPAGPSELLLLADHTARPEFIAADLLSQAEHGGDSQVVCVVKSEDMIPEIETALREQIYALPRYKIVQEALKHSKLICITDDQAAINFVNTYAPEHLILCVANEDFYLKRLINAGSVFIGNYTPESAGDYASGTNHTLPTNGSATAYSGVNIDAFVKKITFQKITKEGLQAMESAIACMAEAEQLRGHRLAVAKRIEE